MIHCNSTPTNNNNHNIIDSNNSNSNIAAPHQPSPAHPTPPFPCPGRAQDGVLHTCMPPTTSRTRRVGQHLLQKTAESMCFFVRIICRRISFPVFLHFLKIFVFLEVSGVQPLLSPKTMKKHLEDMTNDREPPLQDAMRQKKMIISKKYVFCASKYPQEHTRIYSKICSGDCWVT